MHGDRLLWQGLLSCDLLPWMALCDIINNIFNKPSTLQRTRTCTGNFSKAFIYLCKNSSDFCAGGGRGFISMVNINGPAATAGPLSAARRLGGPSAAAAAGFSPPGSRNSTPALPPSHIAHGAQVHVGGSGTNGGRTAALGAVLPPRPTLPPVERANSADSRRKIRYSKRLLFAGQARVQFISLFLLNFQEVAMLLLRVLRLCI